MLIEINDEYEKSINKLIPYAEKEATDIMSTNPNKYTTKLGVDGKDYAYCMWTHHFHKAMNRMAREHKLRNI